VPAWTCAGYATSSWWPRNQALAARPPLSHQIKQLEQELGVRLFERSNRGVWLTEAGELLLEEARRIFVQLDQTVRAVQRVAVQRARISLGSGGGSNTSLNASMT
jgi:DNA-binding transcriptional LysR family regulator